MSEQFAIELEKEFSRLHRININDECRVQLTPAGREQYSRYYEQEGLTPPDLDTNEHGSRFALSEVMHIFGPVLYIGNSDIPFRDLQVTLEAGGHGPGRVINVNDTMYIFVTPDGRRRLPDEYGHGAPKLRTLGPLTELPFNEVARLFGPSLHPGGRQEIDPTIYLSPQQ